MRRVAVRDGVPVIEDFEPAELGDMEVRIRTEYSAISPGTELMLLRNKTVHVPLQLSFSPQTSLNHEVA